MPPAHRGTPGSFPILSFTIAREFHHLRRLLRFEAFTIAREFHHLRRLLRFEAFLLVLLGTRDNLFLLVMHLLQPQCRCSCPKQSEVQKNTFHAC